MRQDLDALTFAKNVGIPVGMSGIFAKSRAQKIGADRRRESLNLGSNWLNINRTDRCGAQCVRKRPHQAPCGSARSRERVSRPPEPPSPAQSPKKADPSHNYPIFKDSQGESQRRLCRIDPRRKPYRQPHCFHRGSIRCKLLEHLLQKPIVGFRHLTHGGADHAAHHLRHHADIHV